MKKVNPDHLYGPQAQSLFYYEMASIYYSQKVFSEAIRFIGLATGTPHNSGLDEKYQQLTLKINESFVILGKNVI